MLSVGKVFEQITVAITNLRKIENLKLGI